MMKNTARSADRFLHKVKTNNLLENKDEKIRVIEELPKMNMKNDLAILENFSQISTICKFIDFAAKRHRIQHTYQE